MGSMNEKRKPKIAPERKAGRPPEPILTVAGVAAAVTRHDGNFRAVAREFGVTRQAIQQLVRNTPELQDVVTDAREGMLDDAESELYGAVRDRDPWAVCFFLKCQGKGRGYVERKELDYTQGATLRVVREIHSADPDADPDPADPRPDDTALPPAG